MSKLSDAPEHIRPFLFHGVNLDYSDRRHKKEAVGDCPLCGKEDHFYVAKKTGQWDCKVCESGNLPSFLQRLYEVVCLPATTPQDYETLAAERGIPADFLKRDGYAVNPLLGKWVIPVRNPKGKIANLLLWSSRPMGTPLCHHHLIGIDELNKDTRTVWIVEGPFDRTAWKSVLGRLKVKRNGRLVLTKKVEDSLLSEEVVLAVPGAGVFKPEWGKLLKDQSVIITFDNDYAKKNKATGKVTKPGWDGTQRTAKLLLPSASSVQWLRWGKKGYTKKLPDGYDLRDILRDRGVAKTYPYILDRIEEADIEPVAGEETWEGVDSIPCESVKELSKTFVENVHFPDNLRDTLLLMLAVVVSTTLPGDQLWFRVIGPPGSGKSTLMECILAAVEYVIATDIMTGIVSGFSGSKKDASLIDQFRDKTIVFHDGDTLINSPQRDKVLGEMRAFYGRSLSARYRNAQTKLYQEVSTTWIICGTDTMRDLNRTFLGERFLDAEILEENQEEEYVRRSQQNTYRKVVSGFAPSTGASEEDGVDPESLKKVQGKTRGFIEYLKTNLSSTPAPGTSTDADEHIRSYANFLSFARARFENKEDDYEYRPRKELATRLTAQFEKLAVCLAYVLGKSMIDEEVLRLIRKVVLDSAFGYQLEIIEKLHRYPKGLSFLQLERLLEIPQTTIKRIMHRMQIAGIVTRRSVKNRSGQRGRNVHKWRLTSEIKPLCRDLWPKKKLRKKSRPPKPL